MEGEVTTLSTGVTELSLSQAPGELCHVYITQQTYYPTQKFLKANKTMPENSSTRSSAVERTVAVSKDIIVVLRDATLLGLAGLLLVFPARFNDLLVSAGFEEGSIVGFKWKAKL